MEHSTGGLKGLQELHRKLELNQTYQKVLENISPKVGILISKTFLEIFKEKKPNTKKIPQSKKKSIWSKLLEYPKNSEEEKNYYMFLQNSNKMEGLF